MNASNALITALVNGKECRTVSLFDRGLSFGDGVFETIRIQAGTPCLWQYHRQRLQLGCQTLGIPLDLDRIDEEIKQLCSHTKQDAVAKIIITRGESCQGYAILNKLNPTRILWLMPPRAVVSEYITQGVTVKVCDYRLPDSSPLARIKHLNRLDQIIARREWNDEYQEGLMLDKNGRVIEGTMSNVFICRGKQLLTPSLNNCGIAGVMREHLMENSSSLGLETIEADIYLDEVLQSEGVFLSNSLIGVWPVCRIEDTRVPLPSMITALQTLANQI